MLGLKIIGKIFIFFGAVGVCACYADVVHVHKRQAGNPQGAPPIRLEVVPNVRRAFVGQQVGYTMRLVYDTRAYEVTDVVPPSYVQDDVIGDPLSEGQRGSEQHDNVPCTVLTWHGAFYPQRVGRYGIPSAQCSYKSNEHRGGFGSFFHMFDSRPRNTRFSPAVSIDVVPLPAAPHGFSGFIGSVSDVQISVDRDCVAQNDAVTLYYHIQGCGNMHHCKHPVLDLARDIKWLPGSVERTADGVAFSYVLQATTDRSIVIPSQKCIVFDPEREVYDLSASNSLSIGVTPAAIAHVADDSVVPVLHHDSAVSAAVDHESDVGLMRRYSFSPALFWAFLFGLLAVFFVLRISSSMIFFVRRLVVWWRVNRMIRKAKSLVQMCEGNGNVEQLYDIFKKLYDVLNLENLCAHDGHAGQDVRLFLEDLYAARFGGAPLCGDKAQYRRAVAVCVFMRKAATINGIHRSI